MAGSARYDGGPAVTVPGWTVERLTPPSRLFGANGLRTGADGRLYVAQVPGSQISAVHVDDGAIETISPMGSDIVAPDDLAFDDMGNLYVTEITEGRVSMRTPGGAVRVIHGDMPVANPITWHQGQLIAGECRMGGRIMALDLHGGAPRIIADSIPMANAFEVGPDGKLYFPVMAANEIWRVGLDGGAPEVVARDLGVPDAVKFDSRGRIVTTQVASGQVLRIDPVSGHREVLADLAPGLDNVAFVGDRIFVSSIPGDIHEIVAPGQVRSVVPGGLQWPLGLAMGADGALFVADGAFGHLLQPGRALELAGMIFSPGFPGYLRGVGAGARAGEWIITTGLGSVARFDPVAGESVFLAHGHDRLMGVAVMPGGMLVVAEYGTGRLLGMDGEAVSTLGEGLAGPMGVAVGDDGMVYVAEADAGRIVRIAAGHNETVAEGLGRPEGLAFRDGALFVVDTGHKALIRIDAARGGREAIATRLPVGAPIGIKPRYLGPIGDMAGPMIPFSDVAAGPDGRLYVSGDAEGSVLAVTPQR